MSNKARRRQKVTGEKYMTALCHIRAECGRCKKGTPCDACLKEPCWTCKPTCPATTGQDHMDPTKCRFDDLGADGKKRCVNCGDQWPPADIRSIRHVGPPIGPKVSPIKLLDAINKGGLDYSVQSMGLPMRSLTIKPGAGAQEFTETTPGHKIVLRVPHECQLTDAEVQAFIRNDACPKCGGKPVRDKAIIRGKRVKTFCNKPILQNEDFDWSCTLEKGHDGPCRMAM